MKIDNVKVEYEKQRWLSGYYFDGRNEGEPPYVYRLPKNWDKEERLGYKLAQKEFKKRWKEHLKSSKQR